MRMTVKKDQLLQDGGAHEYVYNVYPRDDDSLQSRKLYLHVSIF